MVVSCIAHPEQVAEFNTRLAAIRFATVFQERISEDEILFAIRTASLQDANHLGGLLYRAGALEIDIDLEAS